MFEANTLQTGYKKTAQQYRYIKVQEHVKFKRKLSCTDV